MKSIVMPLLGAPPVNGPFHFLAHNPSEIPWMIYTILVVAGFGEFTLTYESFSGQNKYLKGYFQRWVKNLEPCYTCTTDNGLYVTKLTQ